MPRAAEPIAIVGMGCVLPDAFDPDAFARNVAAGHSAIRELSGGRWSWREYLEPRHGFDATHSIRGAAIEGYAFDWRRFRMPPSDAELVNAMQLRTLDAGVQALGSVKNLPHETTGVILGATGLGWQPDSAIRIRLPEILESLEGTAAFRALDPARRARVLADVRARVDARFGPVSEDNVVNASASVAAGRIHMHFDLKGPHFAVDAGFASSLAAVDVGVRMLRDHTLDCALVGGASELLTPLELVAFARLGGLARGDIRPFDLGADGTLLGEGVALFALKRLADAERDGDRIVAVVRGVGGASDGRGKSLVAPSSVGQALAMRRALEDGDVDPSTIGFVECHATGTPVGDASEIDALKRVYGEAAHPILLGSAKAFVGHLRGAAGAVGMLRAIQALGSGVVPAQLGFERACELSIPDDSPLRVPKRATELSPVGGCAVRRAAVSAFGFGGIGYHVVLEAYAPAGEHAGAPAPSRAVFRGPPAAEPIAIVGMGGVFPGGADVPSFFASLLRGEDSTREVPKERWDVERYFDADRDRNETCYTKLGCFLEALPEAERHWHIPPVSLATIDPGQLLVLRATEEAVADAGLRVAELDRDRMTVHLAFLPYQGKKFLADIRVNAREVAREMVTALRAEAVSSDATEAMVDEAMGRFRAALPEITEDTMTGYLGSLNAARVTRLLDLHGPHFVVDSACASSHAALIAAVQSLRHGLSDVALAGGVWCDMKPEFFVAACRFQALSATGSTPFSSEADGFVPGEGGGMFVLMRLSDAVAQGKRIRAVIRSVTGSSDGKGRSVLAPSPTGEASAMMRAVAAAGVAAGEVDYVECHGTGTALGDVVEVDAITRTYGHREAGTILIGSVKSNIGHLNAAAGVVGLVKTVCAIESGIIPASLKAESPNPAIDFVGGTVEVVRANRPWPDAPGRPRRAGVSGFGVGGSNMHLIVEQYRPDLAETRPSGARARVSTRTRATAPLAVACAATLEAALTALRSLVAPSPTPFIEALAETQRDVPRLGEGVRVAIVASSRDELARRLGTLTRLGGSEGQARALAAQGIFVADAGTRSRLALTFPGQGPQYPNMLRDAIAAYPELRATVDEADRIYLRIAGRALSPSFLVDDAEGYEQRDEDIHAAVFVVACAMARFLVGRGVRVDAVLGQSAGELAALVAANVLSFEDGLVAMRSRTLSVLGIESADAGRMVALPCGAEAARALIRGIDGYAALAADNGPNASIVSVDRIASGALVGRMREAGLEGTVLAVSHGYHSQLIAAARPAYRATLNTLAFRAPSATVASTISGELVTDFAPASLAAALERQYVEPVRLRDAVLALHDAGIRLFVECGPKWPLTGFTAEILGAREHVAHATLHPKIGEAELLTRALACAWAHGALPSWEAADELRVPEEIRVDASETHGAEREESTMPNQGSGSRSQEPRFPESERTGAAYARAVAPRRMTPDEAFRRDVVSFMQTLSATIDAFVARWDDGAWVDAESAGIALDAVREAVAAASASTSTLPRPSANGFASESIRAGRMHDLAPPPLPSIAPRVPTLVPPRPVLRPSRAPRPGSSLDEIRRVFTERLAARTGYPLDMLEEHLDLEADLGIDTVKQIAVMGETREHFGLPVDPTFKLRHYPTIASFSAHLAKRLGVSRAPAALPVASKSVRPRSVPARAPSIAPRAPSAPSMPPRTASLPPSGPTYAEVRDVFLARLVAKTGYPLDMLEDDLDLEADLGIDTVKQIAVMGETRERFGLAVDVRFKLRHYPTIRSFCTYLLERIGGSGGPAEGPPRGGGSGGTRVSNGGGGGGAELAATIQLPIELDGPGTALGSGGWVGEVAALRLRDAGLRLVDIRIEADDSSDDAKGVLRISPDGVVRMTAPHGRISAEAQRTEAARPQAGELRAPDWLAELANADRNWSLIAQSPDDAIASIGASARRFRAVRAPRFDEILAQAEIPADASVATIVAIVFETTLAASRLLHVACTGQIAEPVRVESFAVERLPAAGSRISLRACLRAVGRHAVECVAEDGTPLAHAEGIAIGSGQGPSPMPSSPRLLERRTWLRLRRELAQSFEHEASL